MWKFILCSFAFMAWGFYELSGGSDFKAPQPKARVTSTLATYDVPAAQPQTSALVAAAPSVAVQQEDIPAVQTASFLSVPTDPLEVEEVADIRVVKSSRVNMRGGPSTTYDILAKLNQGTEAEILQLNDSGWVKLRVIDSGQVGWMAERLLTPLEF